LWGVPIDIGITQLWSAYHAEGEKPLAAVGVDAYRTLSSDIDETGSFTFGCVWSPVQIRPPRPFQPPFFSFSSADFALDFAASYTQAIAAQVRSLAGKTGYASSLPPLRLTNNEMRNI
jgi:hypothetical protein